MDEATGDKPRRGWRRFFSVKRVLLVFLGLFLLGVAAFGFAYASVNVPQPNDLANAQASIVYYAGGKTEMGRISEVNRESVPLSKIPLHVQRALLAAEDRTFYQNNGVSLSGIGRAVVVAVKGGPTQGGSTITQQYVKNYFLTQDKTMTRKAKEFIISIKIDQQESKSTILANYLNTIYYGRGAYGIQTASKAYFGHDVSKLTVAEGALLASVIRGPSFYDPRLGPTEEANAKARVTYVLDGMVAKGWLTARERATTEFPNTIKKAKRVRAGTAGYIINEVKNDLSKLGLSASDIDRGGLRIETTISRKAQRSAEKAVAENMPSEKDAATLKVGLVAIKPGDGAIVAMYGGKDYSNTADQLNASTQATMQAGSTFKVFGLLAALQKDISTKKRYNGYGPRYLPEFATAKNPRGAVRNFAGESLGRMDLRKALAESVNTIFAQLNVDIAKPGRSGSGVRDAAILAGVPKSTSGLDTTIGNILGSASPHVKDMANAFATIAAEGKRATPYLISRVTFASGRDDYVAEKNLSSAFDKDVTTDVTEAMTHVVTEGTATGAKALGRPAAGKTGTATENKAVWFDGFTPQLAAAVGIYQGNGQEKITVKGITEVTGGSFPVDIWTAFMKGALDGEKVLAFPKRVGLGDSALPPPPVPTTQAPQSPTTPAPTRAPRSEAPTQAPPTSPPASGPETAPPPDNVPPGGPPNTAVPTGAPATAPVKRPGRRKPPKPAPTVALATP